MEERIPTRSEHLVAWAEACAWCGPGMWWLVPPRSPADGTAGGGGERRERPRPQQERAPLTEQEEQALTEIQKGLAPGSSRGAPRPPGRAPLLRVVALVLTLAAVLAVQAPAAAALGIAALLAAVVAVAWAG